MKVRLQNELLIINVCAVLLIIIITFFPSSISHIVLGLPLVLFFPGYTLIAALFPKKSHLGDIQRVALSFGLSLAVVPLIGLALNYTAWGIRLYPILISLAIFIAVASVVAWHRRRGLVGEERFTASFNLTLPAWRGQSVVSKVLSVVLLATIIGAIGTLGYTITTPKVGEKFTEFYILGLEGKAKNYPTELIVGQEARVIVGIINREHEEITYRIEITINYVKNSEMGPVALEHEEKWERVVNFIPSRAGDNKKVEFLLYRLDRDEVYQRVHLWIDVIQ